MPVIVDNADPARLSPKLKARSTPRKWSIPSHNPFHGVNIQANATAEPRWHLARCDPPARAGEIHRDRCRDERTLKAARRSNSGPNQTSRLRCSDVEILSRAGAICKYPPVHARQKPPQVADHRCTPRPAVERHPVHELQKGPLHIVHVAVAVHVLAVKIGHHRENRRKLQK